MSLDDFISTEKNGIRTTYASRLKELKKIFPNARFEVVMRYPSSVGLCYYPSILAPSKNLLFEWKEKEISWDEFEKRFEKEILSDSSKIELLHELKKDSEKRIVFLVCSEKNARYCHRSLLKKYIDTIID